MDDENTYLLISGIQHYVFCPRQWGLIHEENQWDENLLTAQGSLIHERAHNESLREHTHGKIIERSLRVHSETLKITGNTDVVEFRQVAEQTGNSTISLPGETGYWEVLPVEYKRGKSKTHDADRLQLCAQALCLEEMLCCSIEYGALYYNQTHSRELVSLDSALKERAITILEEMRRLLERKRIPKARARSVCKSCSLSGICLPSLDQRESASTYMQRRLKKIQ